LDKHANLIWNTYITNAYCFRGQGPTVDVINILFFVTVGRGKISKRLSLESVSSLVGYIKSLDLNRKVTKFNKMDTR